jgi:hypothetical protein
MYNKLEICSHLNNDCKFLIKVYPSKKMNYSVLKS